MDKEVIPEDDKSTSETLDDENADFVGKKVVITNTTREDLNGRIGVATWWSASKGKYVRLGSGSALSAYPGKLNLFPMVLRSTLYQRGRQRKPVQ